MNRKRKRFTGGTLFLLVTIQSLDHWPHQFNSNHNNTKRLSWLRPQIRPIRIQNPRTKSIQSKNDHRNDITIYYRNVEMRCTFECLESVDVINERTSHIRRSNAPSTLFANDLISDLFILFVFWRISKFYCCFYDFHFVFRCDPLRRYGLCDSTFPATHTPHMLCIAINFMRRNIVDDQAKDIEGWIFIRIIKRVARCGGGGGCASEQFIFSWCMFVQLFGNSAIRIVFVTKSKIVWILWINKFEIGWIRLWKERKNLEGRGNGTESRQWTMAEKEFNSSVDCRSKKNCISIENLFSRFA